MVRCRGTLRVNSMAPVSSCSKLWNMIFKLTIQTSSLATRCGIALWRMPQNLINMMSILVRVAWYNLATSDYLSQSWSKSLSCYDIGSLGYRELKPKQNLSGKAFGADCKIANHKTSHIFPMAGCLSWQFSRKRQWLFAIIKKKNKCKMASSPFVGRKFASTDLKRFD